MTNPPLKPTPGPLFPGYAVYALCNECEKTHEIVIRAKQEGVKP